MDLSIVIVNMNAADMLARCLTSIEQTRGGLQVQTILVDNASMDHSIEAARSACPEVVVLRQARNVGYVPANNLGLAVATGRHVMFLNNDTEVRAGALEGLVRFLDEHPTVGAASGQILNPDGSDQGTARRFPTAANALFGRRSLLTRWFPDNPWSRRYLMGRQRADDGPFEVEILSSACLVVRTDLARELGGMDEDFRLYWVDAELCRRVRDRGFQIYCIPASKIVHFEGQGGSTRTFRQRCRSTIGFHRDAYLAYTKSRHLGWRHPQRLLAGTGLALRAACLIVLQCLRPHKATSSGGRN